MIGVFDSGLGGLSAVKEIHRIMPWEDVIYFGDTGRVPYGTKSPETIIRYAKQDVRFLLTNRVDIILIACGTVSSTALEILRGENDIPIIGVVKATAEKASRLTGNKRVGIIGTTATVKSNSYDKELKALNPDIKTMSVACPLFVPLVENGFIDGDIPYLTAKHYLEPFTEFGADTLILGCTHYPLLSGVIKRVLPNVKLVNSGAESAVHLKNILRSFDNGKKGRTHYFVSDTKDAFVRTASIFLDNELCGDVTEINIEQY